MNKLSTDPARRHDDQRRLLELELIQVQREAEVARLEARAAKLERAIQRMRLDEHREPVPSDDPVSPRVTGKENNAPESDTPKTVTPKTATPTSGKSKRVSPLSRKAESNPKAAARGTDRLPTKKPNRPNRSGSAPRTPPESPRSERTATKRKPPSRKRRALLMWRPLSLSRLSRRGRAMIVSGVAHLLVFIVLALVGLQMQPPRDQISFAASISASEASAMDTFTMESTQPVTSPEEPSPTETNDELSPIGEIQAVDFVPDQTLNDSSEMIHAFSQAASASASAVMSESPSAEKIEFCGIEGGGNHFVYLVDSSKSMGRAFQSARAELLNSIGALKSDQRFYVVFFDAEPDYMRIKNADTDEPTSLEASDDNKAALHRWASGIKMDNGRAPDLPLRFALRLKPDVIFLLSDGEFPQQIEDLLNQENYTENLFGDRQRISIVHTIGYHSQQGEQRMRRIAEQNGGQYRYVPKP